MLRDRIDDFWAEIKQAGSLDLNKLARSTEFTGDDGILLGTYGPYDKVSPDGKELTVDNKCWTDPSKTFDCLIFIGRMHIGTPIGMLNWAVRYYMAAEIMRVNDFYMAREELVYSYMAMLYPNSISYVPMWDASLHLELKRPDEKDLTKTHPTYQVPKERAPYDGSGFSMVPSHSSFGGPQHLAPLNDIFEKMFCLGRDYTPRRKSLKEGEGRVVNEPQKLRQELMV